MVRLAPLPDDAVVSEAFRGGLGVVIDPGALSIKLSQDANISLLALLLPLRQVPPLAPARQPAAT